MAKQTRLRNSGVLAERRHDAFLLALLLALGLNVSFFALQAVIPRISSVLQALGAEPEPPKEEESYPFVLVDPSLLDEQLDPETPPDAESVINREARQEESAEDVPEDKPYIEEGVDEILTLPTGNPGPGESTSDAPGEVAETVGADDENVESDIQEPQEPAEPEPEPEPEPALPELPELPPFPEPPPPVEPETPPLPEPPPPVETPPPPEPAPEPIEAAPPEPPPPVEPPPEPPPEIVPEAPPEPFQPVEPYWEEPPPEPEAPAAVAAEVVDLAMLPVSPDGFFDQRAESVREAYRPTPEQPRPQPYYQEPPRPAAPERREPTERPRRSRSGREPAFKRIGGASRAGGTPPKSNKSTRVNLVDSDPNMRLLAHRYGEYMRKVAEQLQASLNRQIILNPMYYSTGQARIRFSIAANGSLSYATTEYPVDGSNDIVRRISEQTVQEAAPFEPPTEEMLRDPIFQKMSVTVFLY